MQEIGRSVGIRSGEIAGLEVAQEGLQLERAAGGARDQLLGLVARTLRVDVGAQPVSEGCRDLAPSAHQVRLDAQ